MTESDIKPVRTVKLSDVRSSPDVVWRDDLDAKAWDQVLADLGGHPLQSALWGDARREVEGIRDHRWVAVVDGAPVWMIRVEERRLPIGGWIGWAPRGPTGQAADEDSLTRSVREGLRRRGMRMLVTDPWREAREPRARQPRTIWINLARGTEALLADVDKQWRYGVRRARTSGVVLTDVAGHGPMREFYALCAAVSKTKNFELPGSLPLMQALVGGGEGGSVQARLLVATVRERIAAGAFLIRCGRSAHYFWGATDRAFAQHRVGEAVQWGAVEWAINQGCQVYDLEGVDPQTAPSVYAFKKKMGGREVTLEGHQRHPIGLMGRGLAWLDARRH